METTATPSIQILLVEDHIVFRQALALAFRLESNLHVTGQAGSLAEARQLLAEEPAIDVAVLDLDLPDGHGTTLIPEIHAVNRGAEVLVLTASVQQIDLARAVEAGAAGLIHKSTPLPGIVDAIERVAAGESLITRRELIELVQMAGQQRESERAIEQTIASLTPREHEVLLALADGLSDRVIAERLFVSKDTVHSHMVHLLRKLGVESRMQALIFAVKAGLVTVRVSARDEPTTKR
jgi:DNA-binding NarL/FixJ family response regulator